MFSDSFNQYEIFGDELEEQINWLCFNDKQRCEIPVLLASTILALDKNVHSTEKRLTCW